MKRNKVSSIIKQLELTQFQTEIITKEILDMLHLNHESRNNCPDHCPKCNSNGPFIKKGTNTGKQRYQCKSCGAVFVWDTGKLTHWSKAPYDKWMMLIVDTLNCVSLLKSAAKLNLSERTIFRMRC